MEAPEESTDTVYETNIYYGIHYPVSEIEAVCEALVGTKFAVIAGDDREITIDGSLYLRNVNSDYNESRGVIFPDDMSVQGEELDVPTTYCKFDPASLVEREERHSKCVEVCTDMYDIIVAHFKKNSRSVKNLYLGWYVYNCEWCDEESGDESEETPKTAGKTTGKTTGKDAKTTKGAKETKNNAQPKTAIKSSGKSNGKSSGKSNGKSSGTSSGNKGRK